ncbi:nSTAND1 domain-containing NTPase [Couchioplanes caeruleus]|uniref:HTH cro/C1-type domain-containing protein n=2 Tax=Couchioplanes caeruleus TaxID=56438 RepID=A0A1K0FKM0_9ACTN|nr:hypothetical protein [Couchioplanes caeruleus]OJF13353.1 hypothetical protein BG844_15620 [Couchioplanes caeruleus subsp. caeruleus]ROP33565.1 WD40 repeat protein [Couchioplanes caeruleus]
MPRPERPLDESEGPVAQLAAELRQLREKAGKPGYRQMAARVNYSVATLAAAASGRRLPTLEVTLAYVAACDGDLQVWERRWREAERLSVAPAEDPVVVNGHERPPYPGLAAFQPQDAELFFGRGALVDELVRRLRERRFLAVFGPSGAGKSSLVRAGLVPAVGGPAVVLTPGAHPMAELAVHLARHAGVPAGGLLDELCEDPARSHLLVRQGLPDTPPEVDLLVVVDQFEEVFAACADQAERVGFVAALLAMCEESDGRARVVLAVRADHYARFAEHPELLAALADAQVLIGGMSPAQMREAVTRPAELRGARVEGALVATIVAEVGDSPGALPLAAHALREAWHRRQGAMVTLAGYQAAGGVSGAVARTAEQAYELLSEQERLVARRVLLRMVDVGPDGLITRRRLSRAELGTIERAPTVIEAFVAARLVSTDLDTVEIAHEALFRAWPRLQDWVDEDVNGLRIHRRLTEAAAAWELLDRDEGALYRGARLTAATEWSASRRETLTPTEEQFLDASVRLCRREAAAGRRRRLVAWTSFSLASVLLAVLSVVALVQADRARSELDRAYARQLTAEARTQRRNDPELALMLAMRGYELWPSVETGSVLRQATADSRIMTAFREHHAQGAYVAFSPDGQRVASAADDGVVKVWDPAGRTKPVSHKIEPSRAAGTLSGLTFSPDGTQLAIVAATEVGVARMTVWTVKSGNAVTLDFPAEAPATGVAFSPDGRLAAIGDMAGDIRIVDVRTRRVATVLRSGATVQSLAFTQNGARLVAVTSDGSVSHWVLERPGRPAYRRVVGAPYDGAFSADGRRVAVTDGNRVWTATASEVTKQVTLRGGEDTHSVRLSADGQRIAAIRDRTIQVWDLSDPSHSLTLYSPSPVHEFAFSPDGQRLVSSSTDMAVRVWDVGRGLTPVVSVPNAVTPVAMSANGSVVAAFAADRTIRVHRRVKGMVILRDAPHRLVLRISENGQTVATRDDHEISVWNVDGDGRPRSLKCADTGEMRLSPDGRWLAATCGLDQELTLWDLKAGEKKTVSLPEGGAPFVFSPDGQLLASVSAGPYDVPRPITVWRFHTDTVIHRVQTSDAATLLQFGPDSKQLAVQTRDGAFRIYRVGAPDASTVLARTPAEAVNIAFSPDGKLVANNMGDGAVRIQNIDGTGESITLERSGPPIMSLGFAPNGRDLVTLHNDGTVRHLICDVCGPITTVTALARQRITRDFNTEERQKYLHQSD